MPKGTRVEKCVEKLMKQGMAESKAIAICQKSTGQGLQSGKKLKPKSKKGKK